MSRECILIPKTRFEALIKLEKLTQNTSADKTDEIPERKSEPLREASTQNIVSGEKAEQSVGNELQFHKTTLKKKSKPKLKNEIKQNQNGGGKSYVNMSPNQFLNDKNMKHTSKIKWLSFAI